MTLHGREREVGALLEALSRSRLVSLVGAPGVGKTALARSALHGRADVVFVEAAETADTPSLAAKIAQALGVPLRGEPTLAIGATLAGQGRATIVLDGIDRVASSLGQLVATWLRAAPDIVVLTTSRAALGALEEEVLALAPLSIDDALGLFLERAARAGFVSRGTPEERRTINLLVDRLDRLPLAIELAAARASTLTPRQLLERTSRRFELLETRLEGHLVSLRAALEVSFQLLSATEREVLEAAAVFVGPCSAEALEAVLAADGVSTTAVHEALDALVKRSLAQRMAVDDDEIVRFRLLESIRAFAREASAPSAKVSERERRADVYLVDEAERLANALETSDEVRAATAFTYVFDDLRAVVQRRARDRDDLAARAGVALATFAVPRGLVDPSFVSGAVAAARRSRDPLVLARALHALARAQNRAGLVGEPRAALDEALARADDARDAEALAARVLIERARFRLEHGDPGGAEADVREARSRLSDDEPFLAGLADNELGRVHESRGEHEDAARSFTSARARFRAAGSVRLSGIALLNLAVVRYAEGRTDDARWLFEEALELHRRARDPAAEADNLLNIGSLHLTAGRLAEAEAATLRALSEERRLGNRRFEGLALGNLALVAHERGEQALALERYEQALGVFREIGERRFEAVFLPFHAALRAELGRAREACEDFARARSEFERLGDQGNFAVLETLEAAMLDPSAAERRERLARARELLETGGPSVRCGELPIATRILAASRARPPETQRGEIVAASRAALPAAPALVVGHDGRWFIAPGGARVDLSSKTTLRRVLGALVEQRLTAPGVGIDQATLFVRAWKGQRASFGAARDRVYAAIRLLRRTGLEGILLRQDDGYLLDPRVEISKDS